MRHSLFPLARHAPAAAALLCAGAMLAAPATARAQAAAPAASQPAGPTVRPEFGTPMLAAQILVNEGKPQEALSKLVEVEAVPDRTPYETYLLERTRAAASMRLGQTAQVMQALEVALGTGQTPALEEPGLVEAMVSLASNAGDHARVLRWSQRYIDLKGANDGVRVVRIQSQVASGDEAGAKAALLARLAAADQAGQSMPESHLRILLGLQRKAKDEAVGRTLERLAGAYPRPEYWADLVSVASREPGLGDRALLELYRLLRATGNLEQSDLRDEMAQLALKAGQPGEAQVIVDEGFAAGQLGTGAQAAAHQKLRDQVRRQAAADRADRAAAEAAAQRAKDGNAMAELGWAMVASQPAHAAPAAVEPGLTLIEQGIAKGGLRRTTEARLHLGLAQLAAGRKDAARQTLAALAGQGAAEGMATPVRLWSLYASAPAMLPARQ